MVTRCKKVYFHRAGDEGLKSKTFLLPVGQPPVLKLLSKRFWGLSLRRGDTIHGLAWNLECQISHWEADIWGFRPKEKRKIAKIANFFTSQGRTRCPMLVKSVGLMRVIGLQKSLTFWYDSVGKLGIYRQKTAMGHFPPKFLESLVRKVLVQLEKSRRVQKWYGHPLCSCKVWWKSAAARRCEKEKLWVFVFLVCHSWILNFKKALAHQRFSHSNSDIVAMYRSIWYIFQPSLEEEMLIQTFEKTVELFHKVATHLS